MSEEKSLNEQVAEVHIYERHIECKEAFSKAVNFYREKGSEFKAVYPQLRLEFKNGKTIDFVDESSAIKKIIGRQNVHIIPHFPVLDRKLREEIIIRSIPKGGER